MTVFCLEAIELFDTSRNTKFSTFLCHHLRLQCGNYQQRLWIRGSGNEKCRMLPLIHGKQTYVETEDVGEDFANDQVFDDGEKFHAALCTNIPVDSAASVNELLEALSDEARGYLNYLLNHEDQETLVAAFRTTHFRSKVSTITGLSKRQISRVATEVRKRFLDHLNAE